MRGTFSDTTKTPQSPWRSSLLSYVFKSSVSLPIIVVVRLPPPVWKILRSRRTWIILACSPFAFAALIALAYPFTDWLGRRATRSFILELETQGYAQKPEDYFASKAPPAEDLFQHPAVRSELANADPVRRISFLDPGLPGVAPAAPKPAPSFAEPTDVRRWLRPRPSDRESAARQLLQAIAPYSGRMRGVEEALRRPHAGWPLEYSAPEGGFALPNTFRAVGILSGWSGFLADESLLYLETGEIEAAGHRVESCLRILQHLLAGSQRPEALYVHRSVMRRSREAIWEGIVRGAWEENNLAAFEQILGGLDPQRSVVETFRTEAVLAPEILQADWESVSSKRNWQMTRGWTSDREAIVKRLRGLWFDARPHGVDQMKRVNLQDLLFTRGLMEHGQPRKRFSPEDRQQFRKSPPVGIVYSGSGFSEQADIDAEAWFVLFSASKAALEMETDLALLRTGIALERYRLSHGESPASLAGLSPAFLPALPMDPFDRMPLRYRVQSDGSPHLWSVGWDLQDEGGLPHIKGERGDWIWITRPIPGFTKKDYRRK